MGQAVSTGVLGYKKIHSRKLHSRDQDSTISRSIGSESKHTAQKVQYIFSTES